MKKTKLKCVGAALVLTVSKSALVSHSMVSIMKGKYQKTVPQLSLWYLAPAL